MMSKEEVCAAIPFYMADNKITAAELAQKLGVCRQSIYHWIAGKPMTSNNYIALVRLLNDYKEEISKNGNV